MPSERLNKAIAEVQRRQLDPQALEAGINVLSRFLLYSELDPQDEAQGYGFLRGFSSHPDDRISELVGRVFHNRWSKVGFYNYWPAYITQRDRGIYRDEGSARGMSYEAHVAIVELAKVFQAEPGKPIQVRRLDERLLAMLGPGVNTAQLLQELSEKYVLTDELEFVSLLKIQKGRIRVASSAFHYLMPHIPALDAISTPKNEISDGDIRTIRRVQAALGKTFEAVKKYHNGRDWERITVKEDGDPLIVSAGPGMSWVDLESDKEERSNHKTPKTGWAGHKEVVYLDSSGRLHSVSHYQTSGTEPNDEGGLSVSAYEQPPGARDQILVDFWGELIRGRPLGYTRIRKETSRVIIRSEDAFKPALPGSLASAEKIELSENGLKLIWQDISGGLALGRYIFAMLDFRTTFADFGYRSRLANYVSGQLDQLTIDRTNPEYEQSIKQAKGETEDILHMALSSRPQKTDRQEIKFDKPSASILVSHPDGEYTLSYRVEDRAIKVEFKGRGWNRLLLIPKELDVVAIAQSMGRRITAVIDTVRRDREAIAEQVANIRRLGLVELAAYRRLEDVPQSDIWRYSFNSLVKEQKGGDLDLIDQEMKKLDPKTQGFARSFMRALRDWYRQHDQDYADGLVRIEENPRIKIRFIIKKHKLPISEDFLGLIERVFVPTLNS